MNFTLHCVNVLYLIYWFVCVEPFIPRMNPSCLQYTILLTCRWIHCTYFVDNIGAHQGYWPIMFFSCGVFAWLCYEFIAGLVNEFGTALSWSPWCVIETDPLKWVMCVVISLVSSIMYYTFLLVVSLCCVWVRMTVWITFIRSKLLQMREDRHEGGINVILNMITTKMISIK